MKLSKFQRILGAVSKLTDRACEDVKEKKLIENGFIDLWNDYRDLQDELEELKRDKESK